MKSVLCISLFPKNIVGVRHFRELKIKTKRLYAKINETRKKRNRNRNLGIDCVTEELFLNILEESKMNFFGAVTVILF